MMLMDLHRIKSTYLSWVAPNDRGLPNVKVVLIPAITIFSVLTLLVIFGITGSSSGILWGWLNTGSDPNNLVGTPKAIRSDEWFVSTTWTISQIQQGFPVFNTVFPGGMNATIQHDLPVLEWTTLFRPNLLGFWFLPTDQAFALKWFLPDAFLLFTGYLFFVTLLPTRPIASLALSTAFLLSPFVQWWHLGITSIAPGWAFLVMAAVVWSLRGVSRKLTVVTVLSLAYTSVWLAMGIYVPFIVPAALLAVIFSVGFVFIVRAELGWRQIWLRLTPILIAAATAMTVLIIWILTRWDSVQQFLSTKYPGERLQTVGGSSKQDLISILAGPFGDSVGKAGSSPIGVNSSEGSTFLLVGAFLAIAVAYQWFISIKQVNLRNSNWLAFSVLVGWFILLAYYLLPGWDPIAHLLMLDRSTYARMRIGIGIWSFVTLAVFMWGQIEGKRYSAPLPKWVTWGSQLLAISVYSVILMWLILRAPNLIVNYVLWVPILALFLASIGFLLFSKWNIGVAALLVASLLVSANVNPLRLGVYNINDTPLGTTIEEIQQDQPGRWIGIDTIGIMAVVQAGVPALSGFQSSPSAEMWQLIDPDKENETSWNRLALVAWIPQEGPMQITSPAPDQVHVTFDSCSSFAQKNIQFVLSPAVIEQACITEIASVPQGPNTFYIYRVQPAS